MNFYLKLIYLKLLSFLTNLNLILKTTVTILLILSIVGMWYLNSYLEFEDLKNNEVQKISSIDNERAELQRIIKNFENDPIEIEKLNKNINHLFDEEIQTPEQSIQEILQYAQSSNLIVNSFEEKETSCKKNYYKKNIVFDLIGNFYQVLSFLKTIANSCSVVKFNQFQISRLKEGALRINFVCTLYTPKEK